MSEPLPPAAPADPAPPAEHAAPVGGDPHAPAVEDHQSSGAPERAAGGSSTSPAPVDEPKPLTPAAPVASPAPEYRPNYVFLGVVGFISLVLDLGTKAWAKGRLEDAKTFAERHVEVIANHLSFTFARNRGGAWGLFQDEPESVRRPLFLAISALAIGFIVSLYRKLTPQQWALKWGLPLVLGGALGNLVNRIQYNYVVDFIDYRADWMHWFNGLFVAKGTPVSDHWPTFNVADIAIVAGGILMAVDMFTPAPKSGAQTPPVATNEVLAGAGATSEVAPIVGEQAAVKPEVSPLGETPKPSPEAHAET